MRIEINSEVYLYEEQGAVHLRAVSGPGDPTELSADEAERLIEALVCVVKQIRQDDERSE